MRMRVVANSGQADTDIVWQALHGDVARKHKRQLWARALPVRSAKVQAHLCNRAWDDEELGRPSVLK